MSGQVLEDEVINGVAVFMHKGDRSGTRPWSSLTPNGGSSEPDRLSARPPAEYVALDAIGRR
jgi:hypothetical protein